MRCPLTNQELLRAIALETARMAYPGSMSRGPKERQVVVKGTKKKVEKYFVKKMSLAALLADMKREGFDYDTWHKQQTERLACVLGGQLGNRKNKKCAVSAKFIDTFMHQLMKYEQFQLLWPQLHLPLDSQVFKAFATIESPSIKQIKECIGTNTAYAISYTSYKDIQSLLWKFVDELNRRGVGFQFRSRIELNCWLWPED